MRVESVGAAPDSVVHVHVRHPVQKVFGQRAEMPVASAAAAHGVKYIPVFHIMTGTDDAVETDQTVDVEGIINGTRQVGTPRVPEIRMEQAVIVPQLMADHTQTGTLQPDAAPPHIS